MDSTAPVVEISGLEFSWHDKADPVLKIADFSLAARERLFIKGPSGSCKSTLLSLVAGVNLPTSGNVDVLQQSLTKMSGGARDRFRVDHMGVIFQQFNLLPYLSVLDNILLPCRFSKRRLEKAESEGGAVEEAGRLLAHLDMEEALLQRPVSDLRVGQQQRVAAARALIGYPALVIADEPTSSLAADRRRHFIELLFRECEREGAALMFVSHDASLEPMFDRAVHLDEINEAA